MKENALKVVNDKKIEKALTVQLNKELEEKVPELYGRQLVPLSFSGYGISVGDKYVEWKKYSSVGVSEIVTERNDDLPLGVETQEGTGTAKLFWLRNGFQLRIADYDALNSVSGEEIAKNFNREIRANARALAEAENQLLLYGMNNVGLDAKGLLTVAGMRTETFGVPYATSPGSKLVNEFVRLADTFENGALHNETYVARTLVMDSTLYAVLMQNYSTVTDTGEPILAKLQARGLFGRILKIKDFVDKVTGKPKMMILDDVSENFEAIIVQEPMYETWVTERTTKVAVEEKLSEVIAYYPQAIMDIIVS